VDGRDRPQAVEQGNVHAKHLVDFRDGLEGCVLRPVREAGRAVGGALGAIDAGDIVLIAKIHDGGGECDRLLGCNVETAQHPLEQTCGCSIQIDQTADIGDRDCDGGVPVPAKQGRPVPRQSRGIHGPAVAVAEPQRNEAHHAVGQRLDLGVPAELACRTYVESNSGQ
jgi:hypothetical protein